MKNIFNYTDYRDFVKDWIKLQPNRGRGIVSNLANQLGIFPSVLSAILSNNRNLQEDAAFIIAKYMQLSKTEQEYFLILVQIDNSSNFEYKKYLTEKRNHLSADSKKLIKHVVIDTELSLIDQSKYYSSWIYSAIRMLTSINNGKNLSELSGIFQITNDEMLLILEFMVKHQLIIKNGDYYQIGIRTTYLSPDSPFIAKHHTNWRLKSIEKSGFLKPTDCMITSPMTLSKKDAAIIRDKIVTLTSEIVRIAQNSKAECLFVFGVDFISYFDNSILDNSKEY